MKLLPCVSKPPRRRANFENVAALVGLHAERGEIEAAERRYAESHSRYRGVSPFPLALLDFQLGLMWMNEGRLDDARSSFEAARRRVPAYAPAQGHLAEVEAQLGEIDSAVARLYSLALSSDDPDYAAQLARILGDAGRDAEAGYWRRLAAARYDELMASHPEAFADHAAEFWLAAGADPDKALRLAEMNVEVRNTPRARGLLAQAVAANGQDRNAHCNRQRSARYSNVSKGTAYESTCRQQPRRRRGEKLVYTAKTHTTGGRQNGASHSSDGRLDIKLSIPGGPGTGTNPEQLFAAGWSACFEGAMAVVARKRKIRLPADTAIDAEVDLNLILADGTYFLRARLNVSLPGVDRELGAGHRQRSAPDMPVLSSNTRQHRRSDQSCLSRSRIEPMAEHQLIAKAIMSPAISEPG